MDKTCRSPFPNHDGFRFGREAVFWGQLEPGAAAQLGIYDIIFVFLFQIIMTDICFSLCELFRFFLLLHAFVPFIGTGFSFGSFFLFSGGVLLLLECVQTGTGEEGKEMRKADTDLVMVLLISERSAIDVS